jgi:hypothetical protein
LEGNSFWPWPLPPKLHTGWMSCSCCSWLRWCLHHLGCGRIIHYGLSQKKSSSSTWCPQRSM